MNGLILISLYFRNCGALIIGPQGQPFLEETKAALARHDVSHETFGAGAMMSKYPGLSYPSHYQGVLDKSGGLLMADKMLQAYQVQLCIIRLSFFF